MATVQELKILLNQKIDDINKKDEMIKFLEQEMDEKDALIRHLKNEIDKFKQVVRPLTKEIVNRRKCCHDVDDDERHKFGDRPKRQAISAEPLLNGAGEFPIVKIPKSSK